MLSAAKDKSRSQQTSRPQPTVSCPSTSDWSEADTVAPAWGGPEEAFNMRIGIRMQLGVLVLWAVLIGLAVVTIATWV